MQQKGLSTIIKACRSSVWSSMRAFSNASFKRQDLQVTLTTHKKVKPSFDSTLKFGQAASDHILEIDWDAKQGWGAPKISPYHPFEIDPCNTTLHYAIECFEGYKVFVNPDGKLVAFRPDKNHERFRTSCARLCLPDFDASELWACSKELLKIDRDWIPAIDGFSCYVRPTAISMTNLLGVRAPDRSKIFVVLSPVGPYFPDGFKPMKIYTEIKNVRAYPGGAGHYKVGSNYGPTILISTEAEAKGYHQVLWLTDKYITEIGASNFFWVWINENGEKELCTAPLTGLVLPGVTRDSILTLAREKKGLKVSERLVKIDDFITALKEKRVLEAFGAGTAVTVAPVELLGYEGVDYKIPIDEKLNAGPICKEMNDKIKDIQYGRLKHPWSFPVDH